MHKNQQCMKAGKKGWNNEKTLILILEFCTVRIMIDVAYCTNNQECRSSSHWQTTLNIPSWHSQSLESSITFFGMKVTRYFLDSNQGPHNKQIIQMELFLDWWREQCVHMQLPMMDGDVHTIKVTCTRTNNLHVQNKVTTYAYIMCTNWCN
jgi:hypothetical protein